MRVIRSFATVLVLMVSLLVVNPAPAGAVVCHEHPGGCCEDVEVLGKTILHIDC